MSQSGSKIENEDATGKSYKRWHNRIVETPHGVGEVKEITNNKNDEQILHVHHEFPTYEKERGEYKKREVAVIPEKEKDRHPTYKSGSLHREADYEELKHMKESFSRLPDAVAEKVRR